MSQSLLRQRRDSHDNFSLKEVQGGKSQSLPRQRRDSHLERMEGRAPAYFVSIPSSSAKGFPRKSRWPRPEIWFLRLNRFFISEGIPAMKYDLQYVDTIVSQSLLRQRRDSHHSRARLLR